MFDIVPDSSMFAVGDKVRHNLGTNICTIISILNIRDAAFAFDGNQYLIYLDYAPEDGNDYLNPGLFESNLELVG
jgi:hypothetical protein